MHLLYISNAIKILSILRHVIRCAWAGAKKNRNEAG